MTDLTTTAYTDGHSGWSGPRRSPLRIAVLRANGLGDFVFTLPALAALRASEPDAEIVLLGTAMHRELLRDRPGPIDRVEVLPPVPGVTCPADADADPSAVAAAVERLRDERFDVALQLHGGGRYSNRFLRRLHPTLTVGMRTPDADPLDLELPYAYYQPEVMRYLEVVGLLGVPAVEPTPHFAVTEADRTELDRLALPADRPLVVLHPGATDNRRRWSPARYAAVADAMTSAGATVAVIGTAPEAGIAHDLLAAAQGDCRDVVDKLSLGGLAALLERAAVVVANDSGPLHLAAAVGTATVGIFWCGNLINAGPPTRGRHRPQISWTVHCPVCGADCTRDLYPTREGGPPCDHDVSFVDDVSVAEVVDAASALLHIGPDVEGMHARWSTPVT